jgi:hypothetical protein
MDFPELDRYKLGKKHGAVKYVWAAAPSAPENDRIIRGEEAAVVELLDPPSFADVT